jgi:hypothetical protein
LEVEYLIKYRLQWGKPDTISLIPSILDQEARKNLANGNAQAEARQPNGGIPLIPPDIPPYFTADIPSGLVSIIQNDWPYAGTHRFPFSGSMFN